jgi:hypothetical protein
MYLLFVQWRDGGHFHCWPLSWPGYGTTVIWPSNTLQILLNIFICNIVFVSRFQGQIKTGAPCRSERLAKYNQVSTQGFLEVPLGYWMCETTRSTSIPNLITVWFWTNIDIALLCFAAAQDRGRAWCRRSLCRSKVQGTSRAVLNPACLEPCRGSSGVFQCWVILIWVCTSTIRVGSCVLWYEGLLGHLLMPYHQWLDYPYWWWFCRGINVVYSCCAYDFFCWVNEWRVDLHSS